jgi:GLPGLI family protein
MRPFIEIFKEICFPKNKRGVYLFLFVMFSATTYTQTKTGYVIYDSYLNLGLPNHSEKILYFNDYESFFIEKDTSLKEPKERQYKFTEVDVKFDAVESTYTNLLTGKIISQKLIFTDAYVVEEDILKPQWKIINEHKKIGVFTCQKAITKFRGREYVAWFSSEIPVSFGPWKLNSLPGLILEVADSEHKISYSASKIIIKPDDSLKTKIKNKIKIPNIGRKLTLTDFVPILDNEAKVFEKFLLAKEGRDSGLKLVKAGGRESNYEVIYEWEQGSIYKTKSQN